MKKFNTKKARVMIVEDNHVNAVYLKKVLCNLGYHIYHTSETGDDSIQYLKESFPDMPDIILMDIMFPGVMDGIDAAEYIMTNYNIPVIYLTSYSQDQILDRAKKTVPYGYVLKPFQKHEIKATIEIALYKHQVNIQLQKEKEEKEQLILRLKRLNDDLKHFIHGVSHDLHEPIRTIVCFSELLKNHLNDNQDKEIDFFINLIINSASRIKSFMNSVLSYTILNTTEKEFEWVETKDIFDHAVNNLNCMIRETQASIQYSLPMPKLYGDKNQLIQVFQNLISNSIKYCSQQQPEIKINVNESDTEWQVSFQDNGIGIENKYFDKIFLMFKRIHSKEEYPGDGLGLSICKRIIEFHHGRIWLTSEPGVGTTFYFTINKDLLKNNN